MKINLDKSKKIAFICSPRLGDTLISMVVVNNLVHNGYLVDVFSDYLYDLRDWFSLVKIKPAIALNNQQDLVNYSVVLHMYESELSKALDDWHKNSFVLAHSPLYKSPMSLVDIQVLVCRDVLDLQNAVRVNGMQPLSELVFCKHKQRIVIHPTSSQKFRSWSAKKFVQLAKKLEDLGFEPKFIVAQNEKEEWQKLVKEAWLPEFKSLSATAAFIYESAFFVGNDSGIGHLASNLGVPTLTLVLRKNLARQWRPNWSCGEIVLPPCWLITRPLKEKFWKYCISVKMVLRKFNLLQQHCAVADKTICGKINDKSFICYAKYFTAAMQDFLKAPDFYIDNSQGPFFKSVVGDTTTVVVVNIGGKEFVVKRYNIKGAGHFLRKCWRRSNAMISWNNVQY